MDATSKDLQEWHKAGYEKGKRESEAEIAELKKTIKFLRANNHRLTKWLQEKEEG